LSIKSLSGIAVPDDLVLVGHVIGAYGIQGWIRIKVYSTDADALLHARTWWLDKPGLRDVDVLQVRMQGDDVVAQLMGVVDRNAAEALKGASVQVRRSHFPPLADDEFYWIDLIGLAVENLRGEPLGVVGDLMDNGAHPILRVVAPLVPGTDRQKESLIPFVDRFVKTVDRTANRITVDWELDY
jgi:16S rRNA processing protein RimM